jgi:hypothetical protein
MNEVVRIEPTLREPGLIAYECPSCVYVTSVLLKPTTPANAGRARSAVASPGPPLQIGKRKPRPP